MNPRLLKNRARLFYEFNMMKRTGARRPLIAYVLVENRCNLSCFYCFVDVNNKLLYHGRIDNSRNADQIETSDLRNALDAALAGKPIEKTEAKAFGCTIKRA